MSDFANLPSVVVERIIRFAVDTDIDDISTWNYTLPLLAVCSNWRDSATRIVYGRAYLEGPNDRDSDDDSNSNLPKKTFDSNIDLIISTGNVPAVKHIGMYIRNLDSFKASIGRVDSIFGFNDHEWTGVTSIGVAIGIDEDDVEDVDPQVVSNLEKQVDHFAKRMAQRVPRVIHIRMYTDNLRTLSKRFGQKLTEAYSGQLSSLNCCYTNLVGISAFSNQLTSLVVRMKDEIGGILPWIPTAKIKTLKLIDLPVDFDWTQFQSTPEQTCIEFSNLRNLQLAYQREYSEDMSSDYVALVPGLAANGGIKVNFPMLDTTELDVSDINVAQNLLCSGLFTWQCVRSLQIYGLGGLHTHMRKFEATLEQNINVFTKCLSESMPSVINLKLGRYVSFETENSLNDAVANAFAKKARYLHCANHTALKIASFSDDLVYLDVNVGKGEWHRFPKINTTKLQHLRLNNVPFDFSWEKFRNCLEDKIINFSRLEHFEFGFKPSLVDTQSDYSEFIKSQLSKTGDEQNSINCPRLSRVKVTNASHRALQKVIGTSQIPWTNVTSLHLATGTCVSNFDDIDDIDNTDYMSDANIVEPLSDVDKELQAAVADFARKIKFQLPNITYLELEIEQTNHDDTDLGIVLPAIYEYQDSND